MIRFFDKLCADWVPHDIAMITICLLLLFGLCIYAGLYAVAANRVKKQKEREEKKAAEYDIPLYYKDPEQKGIPDWEEYFK